MSRKIALALLMGMTTMVIAAIFLSPRIPQPLAYHHFADTRPWLGIPRFGDVVSNLPFAIVGVWGLTFLLRRERHCFLDPRA